MGRITHIKNKQNIKAPKVPEGVKPPEPPRLKVKTTVNTKIKNGKVKPSESDGIKVALVCIAKNEDNYIQEWVSYNKLIGFDDVFIYQNDWRCSIDDPNVIKIEFDGKARQIEAYNDFIQNRSEGYDWVAFFDVDEFLVLKTHDNIKDFINDYSEFDSIGINWRLFGDNGLTNVDDGNYSLLGRFKMAQKGVNPNMKCITKLGNPGLRMVGMHGPDLINIVDTNKNVITGFNNQLNEGGDYEIAQINHYFCKTREEFNEKIARGRAPIAGFRNLTDFEAHNLNEIEDLSALIYILKNVGK
jgi:hypothetical protein